jgi:glutaredoxin
LESDISGRTSSDSGKAVLDSGNGSMLQDEVPVLITTKTCPKCKIIRKYMDDSHIAYRVVVAGEAEADRLISQYKVVSAPTMIGREMGEFKAFTDIPAIREYLDRRPVRPDSHGLNNGKIA